MCKKKIYFFLRIAELFRKYALFIFEMFPTTKNMTNCKASSDARLNQPSECPCTSKRD